MAAWFKYNADKHRRSRNYFYVMLALTGIILLPGLINYILPERLMSPRRVFNLFFIFTVIFSVYTVTGTLRQLTFGYLTGILITVVATIHAEVIRVPGYIATLHFILSSVFLLFLLYKCLQEVLRTSEIDVQTIYASICGYLILGLIGAIAFGYVNLRLENAYSIAIPDQEPFTFLYYSFVTLTTTGYGDISPVHSIPRTLAIFIAIIGQLYLTVLIAMLIGKYFARPSAG